jgi:hypothetical protein
LEALSKNSVFHHCLGALLKYHYLRHDRDILPLFGWQSLCYLLLYTLRQVWLSIRALTRTEYILFAVFVWTFIRHCIRKLRRIIGGNTVEQPQDNIFFDQYAASSFPDSPTFLTVGTSGFHVVKCPSLLSTFFSLFLT